MARRFAAFLMMALGLGPVALCGQAGPALAYPTPVDFDGQLMRWDIDSTSAPISYEIVADRPADAHSFADSVHEAASLWSSVPTSYFRFRAADGEESARVTLTLQRSFAGADSSAGYATFDRYREGAPDHCAIFVGIGADQSFQAIAKTILHELGHCVGLGHTLVPEAIMSYSLEKNAFALDIDDMAAVSRLYPADGSAPRLPPGCAVGRAAEKKAPAAASWQLALLCAPLVLASWHAWRVRRARGDG